MSAMLSTIIRPELSAGVTLQMLRAGWRRIARASTRHTAIARLYEFDSDALDDIGLTRSDIVAAVYGRPTAPKREKIS